MNSIKIDIKGLKKVQDKLGKAYRTDIGILANKNPVDIETGINMATLGAYHYYGTLTSEERNKKEAGKEHTNRMAARDWLKMPVEMGIRKHLKTYGSKLFTSIKDDKDLQQFHNFLGIQCLNAVMDAFDTNGFGTWASLSKNTIAKKKQNKDKILTETGQLRQSVSFKVEKKK